VPTPGVQIMRVCSTASISSLGASVIVLYSHGYSPADRFDYAPISCGLVIYWSNDAPMAFWTS
jgi:hypothetical protein